MAEVHFKKSNIPDVDADKVDYEKADPVKIVEEQNFNLRGAGRTAVGFYKGDPLIVQIIIHPFNTEHAYCVYARLSDGHAETSYPNKEPASKLFDMMVKKYDLTEVKRPK